MPGFISTTIQLHIAKYDSSNKLYKYLVLKRAENLRLYPGIEQVITGTLEPGETAVETALRELKEETGLEPERMWTLPVITSFFEPKKDAINFVPVFGALVDGNSEVRISNEHTAYLWLDFEECIDRLILPSHKDGTRIFRDFILDKEDKSTFELK
jgi:dATP pyrophosphohydrolase